MFRSGACTGSQHFNALLSRSRQTTRAPSFSSASRLVPASSNLPLTSNPSRRVARSLSRPGRLLRGEYLVRGHIMANDDGSALRGELSAGCTNCFSVAATQSCRRGKIERDADLATMTTVAFFPAQRDTAKHREARISFSPGPLAGTLI